MICHGHIYVNGRRVDRPAFSVAQGDRVTVKTCDKSRKLAKSHLELAGSNPPQSWLQVDADRFEVTVVAMPSRDDVQIPVEEQLIVEMCSR
jgi:small subunit ribosomal protein S4